MSNIIDYFSILQFYLSISLIFIFLLYVLVENFLLSLTLGLFPASFVLCIFIDAYPQDTSDFWYLILRSMLVFNVTSLSVLVSRIVVKILNN